MIRLSTPRFGSVQRDEQELLHFPSGIFGFELKQDWILLGDREHGALYWLQSTEDPELSLPVVDPREFLTDYALHVSRASLAGLSSGHEQLIILCVLTEYQQQLCLNLRHPVVLNLGLRRGVQVVCSDDRPLQYALPEHPASLRQSA